MSSVFFFKHLSVHSSGAKICFICFLNRWHFSREPNENPLTKIFRFLFNKLVDIFDLFKNWISQKSSIKPSWKLVLLPVLSSQWAPYFLLIEKLNLRQQFSSRTYFLKESTLSKMVSFPLLAVGAKCARRVSSVQQWQAQSWQEEGSSWPSISPAALRWWCTWWSVSCVIKPTLARPRTQGRDGPATSHISGWPAPPATWPHTAPTSTQRRWLGGRSRWRLLRLRVFCCFLS